MASKSKLCLITAIVTCLGCAGDRPPQTATHAGASSTESYGATLAQPGTSLASAANAAEAPAAAEKPSLAALDDAQLAGVLEEIADREIRMAQLAEAKAVGRDTKRFAHDVATAHLEIRAKLAALLAQLDLRTSDSPALADLRNAMATGMTTLRMASGKEVDDSYVDVQLREETRALAVVDDVLSRVQRPELRDETERIRARIEAQVRLAQAHKDAGHTAP
jgi:predicted outer membrane protein